MAEIFASAFVREKQMHCSLWNQNLINLTETVSVAVVQRGLLASTLCGTWQGQFVPGVPGLYAALTRALANTAL